jgi:xanthine dehydrogenase molybdenum-binding subunit
MSLKIVGKSVQRLDAIEKVTGRARYSEDFFERDMLVGKVLRSPHAHAVVKRIDVSKAQALPGVEIRGTFTTSGPELAGRVQQLLKGY